MKKNHTHIIGSSTGDYNNDCNEINIGTIKWKEWQKNRKHIVIDIVDTDLIVTQKGIVAKITYTFSKIVVREILLEKTELTKYGKNNKFLSKSELTEYSNKVMKDFRGKRLTQTEKQRKKSLGISVNKLPF